MKLLSPTTIDLVFDQQSDGVDPVLGEPFRFGIGYCLVSPHIPYVPEGRTCYWGGWGGSMIVMDLDRRLTMTAPWISKTRSRRKAADPGCQ